jgi:hypothetical protein
MRLVFELVSLVRCVALSGPNYRVCGSSLCRKNDLNQKLMPQNQSHRVFLVLLQWLAECLCLGAIPELFLQVLVRLASCCANKKLSRQESLFEKSKPSFSSHMSSNGRLVFPSKLPVARASQSANSSTLFLNSAAEPSEGHVCISFLAFLSNSTNLSASNLALATRMFQSPFA